MTSQTTLLLTAPDGHSSLILTAVGLPTHVDAQRYQGARPQGGLRRVAVADLLRAGWTGSGADAFLAAVASGAEHDCWASIDASGCPGDLDAHACGDRS